MRTIHCYIVLLLFVSCSAHKMPIIITTGININPNIYANPKLDVTEKIYDNLSESKMPKVLSDYYQTLKSGEYYSLEFRVDTIKTKITPNGYSTTLIVSTKKAKDGYLHISQFISDSIQIAPIDFLINSDTVNNKKMIDKLLSFRKKEIRHYFLTEDGYFKIINQ